MPLHDQPEKKELNFNYIQLLTWNIYKGQRETLKSDLHKLLERVSLANLQEAYSENSFLLFMQSLSQFTSILATSYIAPTHISTGVLSLSVVNPNLSVFIRSHEREPIIRTPKMILAQYFTDSLTRQTVLVLNIHSLNFVTQRQYESQILQALECLRSHNGPVIFSGDFNTWNSYRMNFLKKELGKLNIYKIDMNHPAKLVLDHVFIRGFKSLSSTVLKNITSSDHYPIISTLSIESSL